MNSLHSDTYRIESYDTDCSRRARITSLCNFFQESAWKHAHAMGLGWSHLDERGELWVLSRLDMHIVELPRWRDLINLTTWASGVENLFALRDFRITAEDGSELAAGTTSWLVIDTATRRPKRMSRIAEGMIIHSADRALGRNAERLNFTLEGTPKRVYEVGYSDIDMNNHVNNVTYIRWALDSFELPFLRERRLTDLSINFLAEALYGDKVSVTASPPAFPQGPYKLRIFRSEGDQEIARAACAFAP
jgi:medium-chain acyl-[acyl-carrier-protein] hydrolase